MALGIEFVRRGAVSKTTILTAPAAVATQKFAAEADRISKRLGDSKLLMTDETPIRIGKGWGYVWVFIGEYGIKFTVAGSRGGPVLDLHCPHFHIPIVVDGYAAYQVFKVRQRYWAHVLRDAELLVAMHDGSLKSSTGGSSSYSTAPRACRATSATKICKNG